MAVGIFNPKDTSRTTATRPTHVMLAEGVRKWMSDAQKSQPKSQDWNAIIANLRGAADYFAITDEETNTDNILRDAVLAAVNDLSTGSVVTLASAATVNLGATRNSRIDISGSVSITSFGATANKIRIVRTTGAPLITLPNGQSYQAAAGDAFLTASDNAGAWRILSYWPAGDQLFGLARPTIASAATVDIGAQQAFAIEISGANAISSLGTVPNRVKLLRMAAAASFTHGANIIVPGAVNWTAAAGDHVLAVSNAAGVYSIFPLLGDEKAISIAIRRAADAAAVKVLLALNLVDNTADVSKPVSTAQQTALNLKANLASPTLTGTPAAPTATPGTNTTQIATAAFVQAAIALLVDGAPAGLNTLNELAAAIGDDANFAATITAALAAKLDDSQASAFGLSLLGAANDAAARALLAAPDTATILFTPTVEGTSAAGVGTYVAQAGRATRIGNRILFNIRVSWTSHTGTGNIIIKGLPVPALAGSSRNHVVNINAGGAFSGGEISPGATEILPLSPATAIQAVTYVVASGQYEV